MADASKRLPVLSRFDICPHYDTDNVFIWRRILSMNAVVVGRVKTVWRLSMFTLLGWIIATRNRTEGRDQ
jgi:hypothetical protein